MTGGKTIQEQVNYLYKQLKCIRKDIEDGLDGLSDIYVPYLDAIKNVNLGTHAIIATNIVGQTVSGTNINGSFVNATFINGAPLGEANPGNSSFPSYYMGIDAGLNSTAANSFFVGISAGENAGGNNNTFIGQYAGRENVGYDNVFFGDGAGAYSVVSNSFFVGSSAGENASGGGNLVGLGRETLQYNTGVNTIAISNYSGKYNDGDYGIFLGYYSGENNDGDYVLAFGRESGRNNQGDRSVLVGNETGENNTGHYVVLIGERAGQFNDEDDLISIGKYSSPLNIHTKATFIGANSNPQFVAEEDPSTLKSFDFTDINISTDQITVTGHGFGTAGDNVRLRWVVQSTKPQYYDSYWGNSNISTNTYWFRVIDDDTLEWTRSVENGPALDIISAGSGNGHTLTALTVAVPFDNVTGIGYGAKPTKSNQMVLGNEDVEEVVMGNGDVLYPLSVPTNRVTWEGTEWDSNKTYPAYSFISSEGWAMMSEVDTTEYPFPQPNGVPYYVGNANLSPVNNNAKQVLLGQRYTSDRNGYVTGYKLSAKAGFNYKVFSILDPLGTSITREILSYTAIQDNTLEVNIEPIIVEEGTVFDVIVLVSEPDPSPTETLANYDYNTPNNPTTPSTGEIQHSGKESSYLSIHVTDDDGTDRTSLLSSLALGDKIVLGGVDWTVQSTVNNTTYFDVYVSPGVQSGVNDGVHSVAFSTVIPTQMEYEEEVNGASSNPNIQGIIAIDDTYANATFNQNLYILDLKVQDAKVPVDWSVVATSASATSPGDSGVGIVSIKNYNVVKTSTSVVAKTNDFIAVDTSAGDVTIILPSSVNNKGGEINITKEDNSNNKVIINSILNQPMNGQLTDSLTAQWDNVTLVSMGDYWIIK